jgi:hypothetical protein
VCQTIWSKKLTTIVGKRRATYKIDDSLYGSYWIQVSSATMFFKNTSKGVRKSITFRFETGSLSCCKIEIDCLTNFLSTDNRFCNSFSVISLSIHQKLKERLWKSGHRYTLAHFSTITTTATTMALLFLYLQKMNAYVQLVRLTRHFRNLTLDKTLKYLYLLITRCIDVQSTILLKLMPGKGYLYEITQSSVRSSLIPAN